MEAEHRFLLEIAIAILASVTVYFVAIVVKWLTAIAALPELRAEVKELHKRINNLEEKIYVKKSS